MNVPSSLRRFVRVSRDFGLAAAIRVTCSKIRGLLWPALALPGAPVYTARRELSFLLDAATQEVATLHSIVDMIAARGGSEWEICIGEPASVEARMAGVLASLRGTRPWIRIVTTDRSIDGRTAALWTVEQATGQFVALVAPGSLVTTDAVARLLARLDEDSGSDCAVLLAGDGDHSGASRRRAASCRILVQRKSTYLDALPEKELMTAVALVESLEEAGVPIVYVTA